MDYKVAVDFKNMMKLVKEKLAEHGVLFEADIGFGEREPGEDRDSEQGGEEGRAEGRDRKPRVKVVCVAPDLQESVQEMGESSRDQVVMVRVDAETIQKLDAWVETGAVKSRSEAAALFIREGLKVRASELSSLEEALKEVEEARERLKREAKKVFGRENGQ